MEEVQKLLFIASINYVEGHHSQARNPGLTETKSPQTFARKETELLYCETDLVEVVYNTISRHESPIHERARPYGKPPREAWVIINRLESLKERVAEATYSVQDLYLTGQHPPKPRKAHNGTYLGCEP